MDCEANPPKNFIKLHRTITRWLTYNQSSSPFVRSLSDLDEFHFHAPRTSGVQVWRPVSVGTENRDIFEVKLSLNSSSERICAGANIAKVGEGRGGGGNQRTDPYVSLGAESVSKCRKHNDSGHGGARSAVRRRSLARKTHK
jgi:hypothetical protein